MSASAREPDRLDAVLAALANEHRRAIVYALGLNPTTISRLANERGLSLPAMNKHVRVLERAELVSRRKVGRSNVLTLDRSALATLQSWLGEFQPWWGSDTQTLDNYSDFLDTNDTQETP